MRDFAGKVAVVTGGASGIGRALGARLAAEGARVVLADVQAGPLEATVAELGSRVTGVVTDVSSRESVEALAERAYADHGVVHLLFNNAGIGTDETRSRIWDAPVNDWAWAFSVNVWGVLHGIRAFVPRMLAGGEPGHVVNTSSGNGGLAPLPTTPIYSTTKAAVTTISEVLHLQLLGSGAALRAHVLFPGPHIVNTGIFDAARSRPAHLPDTREDPPPPPTLEDVRKMAAQAGIELGVTEPEEVADHTLEGLRAGRFWILPPSPDGDARVRARFESILARSDPQLAF